MKNYKIFILIFIFTISFQMIGFVLKVSAVTKSKDKLSSTLNGEHISSNKADNFIALSIINDGRSSLTTTTNVDAYKIEALTFNGPSGSFFVFNNQAIEAKECSELNTLFLINTLAPYPYLCPSGSFGIAQTDWLGNPWLNITLLANTTSQLFLIDTVNYLKVVGISSRNILEFEPKK